MDQRTTIRPHISNIGPLSLNKPEEKFQNVTLRPIIKMQHDLIIGHLSHYLSIKKIPFNTMIPDQKKDMIHKIFQNDHSFKAEMRGMIMGHFTVEEYHIYASIYREINRRMMSMVKDRMMGVILNKT